MGSLTWNGGSGDWTDPTNWTVISGSDPIPMAGDDVTINAPGTYVVTVSLPQSVEDITLSAPNATLQVAGLGGALPGTLAVGGTISATAGTLDLTSGQLAFTQSQTLDNVAIEYGSRTTPLGQPFAIPAGTTLTLGPNVTMTSLEGAEVNLGNIGTSGALVNAGTIVTAGSLEIVTVTAPIDNEGSLNDGGIIIVSGDLVNNGNIGFTPGLGSGNLTIGRNLTGNGAIRFAALGVGPIGEVSVAGTIGALQQIVGPVNGNFLLVASSIDSSAIISNFFHGSTIDLTGLPYSSSLAASYSGNPIHGSLTINDGTTTEAVLQLDAVPDGVTFDLAPDSGSGTLITTSNPPVPCFVTGTRIRTERGEVAVEELRVGDLVPAVRAGGSLPIVWIGRCRVAAHRHSHPWEVYPVRVAAGAFADFVPARELWLSPEHCVFLHGVLVPVRVLINGTSIRQEPCDEVTYWHVELASHDIMLCEGAWAESYLDMGNRSAFIGNDANEVSLPDFSREFWEARACQAQERGGPVVEAIRAVIDARAGTLAQAA